MEVYFLLLLIALMIAALSSGFPVAFALPGSAILTIFIAAAAGYLITGNTDAFFANGGPSQWLSAGVTNFRSLYWIVERDTLIAIPLFIFMGIMLQRSRIAEDLLVSMAQLFGPVPGGLGISVVFVGALLAATTGIVGATVIAMGLISLPAMLRNNYSKPLACGTICASGTLGQIIPPSIVLIILADQLSSAADQASTTRKAAYRTITGEYSMPGNFDVVSASAGDMFMGAFIPGMILVGLYMLYILVTALLKPEKAPPVPYEGKYDGRFFKSVFLALTPPLLLIFAVLGSIILGIATVNQAGAIGAIGALLMGSYRLTQGRRGSYAPAILALLSVVALGFLVSHYNLNIKNIQSEADRMGIRLALIATAGLLTAVFWAIYRAWKIDNTLVDVMTDTAKTTSMVFIILIGAAMLTAAFRAFGGEELVKEYLTSLPGGFWTQFLVVMLVIFLLGFFLDFIEISVVVVPIVAPILLADPSANITAVWLGVMIGLNIQTSFLTPPFGFALFYLRGVAPKSVRTTDIYKGAVAFILLQLSGLGIAAAFPSLINYLPNRVHLTSETAPPPNNPRLQLCLEQGVFEEYDDRREDILEAVKQMRGQDLSWLPEKYRQSLKESLNGMEGVFEKVAAVRQAAKAVEDYAESYRPLHDDVRRVQVDIRRLDREIEDLGEDIDDLEDSDNPDTKRIDRLRSEMLELKQQRDRLQQAIPAEWDDALKQYKALTAAEKKARNQYRRQVDDSYQVILDLRAMIEGAKTLQDVKPQLDALFDSVTNAPIEEAMAAIKVVESRLSGIKNAYPVKSKLSKARRVLKKKQDRDAAAGWIRKAEAALEQELTWRKRGEEELLPLLQRLDAVIASNIGLRMQKRFSIDQAEAIAACRSHHKDVSLAF